MTKETRLAESKTLTAEELTKMVGDKDLKVIGFYDHKKASERYVVVSVASDDGTREWRLPYYYRRTNVRVDTAAGLVDYVRRCRPRLSAEGIEECKARFGRLAKSTFGRNAGVTLAIFRRLLKNCGGWVWNKDFGNPNPQRRIQDIKERGFTIATKIEAQNTYHMLLPFDVVKAPTYETIPAKVRRAIFAALEGLDAYSGRKSGISTLPDHKFPEIRWEKETAESNEGLTEAEMRRKFQLVPESINQSKREVCRRCFQTGRRGKLSEIDFFYAGGEEWPADVPKTGRSAEAGCVGCFWYDMSAWRDALNELIGTKK